MTVRVPKSALLGVLGLFIAPIPAVGQTSDTALAAAGVDPIPGFRAGAVMDQR